MLDVKAVRVIETVFSRLAPLSFCFIFSEKKRTAKLHCYKKKKKKERNELYVGQIGLSS